MVQERCPDATPLYTWKNIELTYPVTTKSDALCDEIIRNEFAPQFRTGNYDESFRQGLTAVTAAARGEYHGSGKTVAQQTHEANGWVVSVILILMLLFFAAIVVASFRKGHMQRIRGAQSPKPEGVTLQVHQIVAAAAEAIAGSRVAVEILGMAAPVVTGKKSTVLARCG